MNRRYLFFSFLFLLPCLSYAQAYNSSTVPVLPVPTIIGTPVINKVSTNPPQNIRLPMPNYVDKSFQETVVNNAINRLMKNSKALGAAVVVYNHGKLYYYNYGYANKQTGMRVSQNTIFEIGSITKSFTATLLGEEVAAGKMRLSDTVGQYFPNFTLKDNSISRPTMQELASHTAGLPFMLPNTIKTYENFLTFLSQWRPRFAIGTQWAYSNIGFGLIGYALEERTHLSYAHLLQEKILGPLQMTQTTVNAPNNYLMNYRAQGYNWQNKPIKPYEYKISPAGGAINSSTQDLGKYLAANIDQSNLPPTLAEGIRITQRAYYNTKYGMQALSWELHALNTLTPTGQIIGGKGLYIRQCSVVPLNPHPYENALYDKTGTMYGFSSYMAFIPAQKLGVVILLNKVASIKERGIAGRTILLKLVNTH